jgi:hypothetical protein
MRMIIKDLDIEEKGAVKNKQFKTFDPRDNS